MFPAGFTATSMPNEDLVKTFIATADTIVTLQIKDLVGQAPSITDAAAPIAVRYIIEWTKAQVVRVAYAGRDPNLINAAASPYDALAKSFHDSIDALGAQAEGTGESSPLVVTSTDETGLPERALIITNRDLDACSGRRGRW